MTVIIETAAVLSAASLVFKVFKELHASKKVKEIKEYQHQQRLAQSEQQHQERLAKSAQQHLENMAELEAKKRVDAQQLEFLARIETTQARALGAMIAENAENAENIKEGFFDTQEKTLINKIFLIYKNNHLEETEKRIDDIERGLGLILEQTHKKLEKIPNMQHYIIPFNIFLKKVLATGVSTKILSFMVEAKEMEKTANHIPKKYILDTMECNVRQLYKYWTEKLKEDIERENF